MKTIPLSKGYVALVDDEDFERASRHNWHVEIRKNGPKYAQTTFTKHRYITAMRLHRFIMGCTEGDGAIVDHVNGDGLDNRKANLRRCTQKQNVMNQAKSKGRYSKYKGVSKCQKGTQWRAYIKFAGKHCELARGDSEEDMAVYYDVAAQLFFGEYARLNGV